MTNLPKCETCERAYRSKLGCSFSHVVYDDGQEIKRERVSFVVNGCCPDCFAPAGRYHHTGCDQEKCPRCGVQILACLDGEFGHKIEQWKRPASQRRQRNRRIRVAFALSDKSRRAHLIIVSGHTYLKRRMRDWMGVMSRDKIEAMFSKWRAAGIDVVAEEKTFREMAMLRESIQGRST